MCGGQWWRWLPQGRGVGARMSSSASADKVADITGCQRDRETVRSALMQRGPHRQMPPFFVHDRGRGRHCRKDHNMSGSQINCGIVRHSVSTAAECERCRLMLARVSAVLLALRPIYLIGCQFGIERADCPHVGKRDIAHRLFGLPSEHAVVEDPIPVDVPTSRILDFDADRNEITQVDMATQFIRSPWRAIGVPLLEFWLSLGIWWGANWKRFDSGVVFRG